MYRNLTILGQRPKMGQHVGSRAFQGAGRSQGWHASCAGVSTSLLYSLCTHDYRAKYHFYSGSEISSCLVYLFCQLGRSPRQLPGWDGVLPSRASLSSVGKFSRVSRFERRLLKNCCMSLSTPADRPREDQRAVVAKREQEHKQLCKSRCHGDPLLYIKVFIIIISNNFCNIIRPKLLFSTRYFGCE